MASSSVSGGASVERSRSCIDDDDGFTSIELDLLNFGFCRFRVDPAITRLGWGTRPAWGLAFTFNNELVRGRQLGGRGSSDSEDEELSPLGSRTD